MNIGHCKRCGLSCCHLQYDLCVSCFKGSDHAKPVHQRIFETAGNVGELEKIEGVIVKEDGIYYMGKRCS